jgi:NAD(P)-dependent dehydrogenase (short-subunit alcohol dehydrogenase family)
MTGRLDGKAAFITGAARAHAVRMASEGADVIAVDITHHKNPGATRRSLHSYSPAPLSV